MDKSLVKIGENLVKNVNKNSCITTSIHKTLNPYNSL